MSKAHSKSKLYPFPELKMMLNTAAVSGGHVPVPSRRTVDAFTRTLHALLALSFAGAYITAESEFFRWVHVNLGYTLGGLLVARLLWGFMGPRYARWSAMWGKLRGLSDWLYGLRTGQPQWRQVQNLYLVWTVAVVLLSIAPVVLSGYVVDQEWTGEWMEDIHEFFGNLMLIAVLAHVAGVVLLSLLRRRNLAKPMLTGRVNGVGPDLIKSNHKVLAALLVVAVVLFWVVQWQSAEHLQTTGSVSWLQFGLGQSQSITDDD
jgi:cytochrome b